MWEVGSAEKQRLWFTKSGRRAPKMEDFEAAKVHGQCCSGRDRQV